MKLTHEQKGQLTVVTLRGELTGEHSETLRRTASELLAKQARDFVLDLSATEFLDSRGLETLLWLQERSVEKLGQVRLAGANEHVAKILEMTRLAGRFDCHGDVDTAIRSLS